MCTVVARAVVGGNAFSMHNHSHRIDNLNDQKGT